MTTSLPAPLELNAIVSPTDYASLGQVLADAGIDPNKQAALIARIQELSTQAAMSVALGAAKAIAEELQGVHVTTATDIYSEIIALNPGGGIVGVHNKCARVALNAAQRRPRNATPR